MPALAVKPWHQYGSKYNHTTGVSKNATDVSGNIWFEDQNDSAFRSKFVWMQNDSSSEIVIMRTKYNYGGNTYEYMDTYGTLVLAPGEIFMSEVACDGFVFFKTLAADDLRWEAMR